MLTKPEYEAFMKAAIIIIPAYIASKLVSRSVMDTCAELNKKIKAVKNNIAHCLEPEKTFDATTTDQLIKENLQLKKLAKSAEKWDSIKAISQATKICLSIYQTGLLIYLSLLVSCDIILPKVNMCDELKMTAAFSLYMASAGISLGDLILEVENDKKTEAILNN